MQDNISCALITAFERQYDTSWDDPKLRNERLAMRYGWTAAMEAKPCLHQIQEPAAAEQATWHAGLDEGRAQAAPAAVAVPVNPYPENTSRNEAWEDGFAGREMQMCAAGGAYARAYREGAAALAATPAAAPNLKSEIMKLPLGTHGTGYGDIGIAYRAGHRAARLQAADLVSSAPADHLANAGKMVEAAAAPVVLPEPLSDKDIDTAVYAQCPDFDAAHDGPSIDDMRAIVRALLATATGLPAQADMPDSFREWFAKNYPADTIIVDPDWHAKSIFRMAQAHARLAAPQAQADARDAQLLAFAVSEIRRDGMGHAPVLYVSKGQLNNHRDPDGPDSTAHGRYLPARITPAGKFTTPLFAEPHALTPAARDVLAERQRQITQEGYDPQHDDDHVNDEIAAMAALFLMPEGARDWDATSTSYGDTLGEAMLPCDWEMPNFGDDRRRQLVKGTAMGLAEIERIDRAAIAAAKGE